VPNYLVLLGGGKSTRYGKDKLSEKFMGKSVVDILFSSIPWQLFDEVVWVGNASKVPAKYRRQVIVAPPGETRYLSVKNGLDKLNVDDGDKVLIHDGARFLASHSMFERVIAYLDRCDVVYPAIPPTDALRFHHENEIKTVSREHVYRVQTPQGFRGNVIKAIVQSEHKDVYDEVMIAEKLGFRICRVDGDITNIKLTYPEDIRQMEKCISRFIPIQSIGIGFDSHMVGEGGFLYVGGVKVSDEYHSIGWSDGDALLHATVDAILSAYGVSEDIGSLFPPGNMDYKGIRSTELLRRVVEKYGPVSQMSAVVILSKVKLKSFRSAIIGEIKKLIGADKVAITFKTAEGFDDNLYIAYVIVSVVRRDEA